MSVGCSGVEDGVGGLVEPVPGFAMLAEGQVVQVVADLPVAGSSGQLPPEPGAFGVIGQKAAGR
ncbi:hypothetical protein GCM10010372_50890 [Streptomyces tauricus]|nr:hypothetical protein GCM10010372_50890 [Streptomyces tauricus]